MCMVRHNVMYDRNDTVFNPDTCLKDNVEK